jgi:hypothetical protein
MKSKKINLDCFVKGSRLFHNYRTSIMPFSSFGLHEYDGGNATKVIQGFNAALSSWLKWPQLWHKSAKNIRGSTTSISKP